ncbi:MAG: hypothetical protein JWR61_4578 [Ferruginibacter sp.]|nr:hypothetical protein [Ferruginibacter sp.]
MFLLGLMVSLLIDKRSVKKEQGKRDFTFVSLLAR